MRKKTLTFRQDVCQNDAQTIRDITASSGFFSDDEVNMAVELVEERLAKGTESDYAFLFAESEQRALGYACFGRIACTLNSYDLYWIAVHNSARGTGIGKSLLRESEGIIARQGGRRIYVETASRTQYAPTRAFYLNCGYQEAAFLEDFYAPGDGKVIYVKTV